MIKTLSKIEIGGKFLKTISFLKKTTAKPTHIDEILKAFSLKSTSWF